MTLTMTATLYNLEVSFFLDILYCKWNLVSSLILLKWFWELVLWMDSVYVAVISNYVRMFIFQWDRTMFVLQWDWQAETVYSNQAVHAFSYLSISLSLSLFKERPKREMSHVYRIFKGFKTEPRVEKKHWKLMAKLRHKGLESPHILLLW